MGVSLGETGSRVVSPPPSPTGDTSPPSDTLGGSKRLVERPEIFGRRGEGRREMLHNQTVTTEQESCGSGSVRYGGY